MTSTAEIETIERLVKELVSHAEDHIAALKEQSGPSTAQHIVQTRFKLLSSNEELNDAVRGPIDSVADKLRRHNSLIPMHLTYSFNLPQKVPLDGTISFSQLASQCDTDEDKLRRIMRYGMTLGLFTEPSTGFVAHSRETRALAASEFLMDYAGVMCEEFWPAASQVIPAMRKWKASESREHCGFALTAGAHGSSFETFSAVPERGYRFDRFMKSFGTRPGYSYQHLCKAFDWASVSKVVDVGGGSGAQGIALAESFPSLQIVTQDLPVLEAEAKRQIPVELTNRVHFQVHDFFERQTEEEADVYHFRMIFHDYGDQDGARILRALLPAMGPRSKIVVTEHLIPPQGELPRSAESSMRSFDMTMLESNNSFERDSSQWERLFGLADERLTIEDVVTVRGSLFSYIRVGLQEKVKH